MLLFNGFSVSALLRFLHLALNLPIPSQTFDAIWTDIYALSAGMFMTRQWGMRRAGLSPELRLRTFRRIGFARSAALERSTLMWRCKIEGPGWGPLIVYIPDQVADDGDGSGKRKSALITRLKIRRDSIVC